jgi:hypothetical protein
VRNRKPQEAKGIVPVSGVRPTTVETNDSAVRNATLPACRSWYRLHLSTWIAVAIALAFVTIVEVPARFCSPHGLFPTIGEGAPSHAIGQHGWPFVYLYEYDNADDPDERKEIDELIAKEGLPWTATGGEGEILEKYGQCEPIWLVAEAWKFSEDIYLCKTGLALDIAVVVAFVALVAFPYECWARRHWRYSLRTLFCVLFLVAAVFAWWRTAMNRWEREIRAVEPLRKKEAVFVDRSAPLLLRMLVGDNHLKPFNHVSAIGTFSRWTTKPRRDVVENHPISDDDLEKIANLGHLKSLSLYSESVTDRCLRDIQGMAHLEELDLSRTRITDIGVKDIRNLPRLDRLALSDNPITGDGLGNLKDLPRLHFLHLDNTNITDSSLHKVGELTKLQGLFLDGTKITDAGLRHLEGMHELKILNIRCTKVTKEGVCRLHEKLPNCSIDWDKPIDP